jgi:hypothetical protein
LIYVLVGLNDLISIKAVELKGSYKFFVSLIIRKTVSRFVHLPNIGKMMAYDLQQIGIDHPKKLIIFEPYLSLKVKAIYGVIKKYRN